MIIRKPYAFIIKHFKAIHLIILGCIIFSIYNLGGIGGLINTLISSRTYTYSGADVYIVKAVYPFMFVGFILSTVLFWLLRLKKKPIGLYVGLMIYFIASVVFYLYVYSVFGKLINEQVEIDTLTFVKDILSLVRIPGYIFIAVCLTRGIGFNIKQFNFSKDLEELKITDVDNEEFEFIVGQNNYKYLRTVRRTIREAKYYVLENRLIVSGAFLIITLLLGFFGFRYYKQSMEKIKAQEVSTYNGVSYVVNKSYVTARDQKGDWIKEGSKFVIVDMSFNNTTDEKKVLDLDRFRLVNGELLYSTTFVYNSKFYDLGLPYEINMEIPKESMLNRTLIFEIPDSVITTNFILRYEYGLTSKKNDVFANYIKFDVKTNNIDDDYTSKDYNINEEIVSNVNGENEFHLSIRGYNISDTFNDKYIICNRELKCGKYTDVVTPSNLSKNTMLVLDISSKIFDEAKFTKKYTSINDIFANFAYIEYDSHNRNVEEPVTIVQNSSVDDKVFLLVDRKIKNSNYIKIKFRFRNNTYVVPIKY